MEQPGLTWELLRNTDPGALPRPRVRSAFAHGPQEVQVGPEACKELAATPSLVTLSTTDAQLMPALLGEGSITFISHPSMG